MTDQNTSRNKMQPGYPLRVWAVAALLPAIAVALYLLVDRDRELFAAVGGGVLLAGALFSLPALIGNIFLCRKLAESNLETSVAKTYIILAGVGFVVATFGIGVLIWGLADAGMTLAGVGAYSISAGIGAAIFQLREKEEDLIPED